MILIDEGKARSLVDFSVAGYLTNRITTLQSFKVLDS